MKLRKFFVYVDDGTENPIKLAVPAKNEKYAREFAEGIGEVVAIKDVTEEYPISLHKVSEALYDSFFCKTEIDFILRTLSQTSIADKD